MYSGMLVGYVALAETIEELAPNQRAEAAEARVSAALAWRLAVEALEAAQRADATGPLVREATDVVDSMRHHYTDRLFGVRR